MAKNNILFNKKGIEWYHLLILLIMIMLVFFVPFKEDPLVLADFKWTFLDQQGNVVDPEGKTILGGFGTTTDASKLRIGYSVGTILLAQTPFGMESSAGQGTAYSVSISFPKSDVLVTHKSDCTGSKIDGVSLDVDSQTFNLFEDQKRFLTTGLIISPNQYPNCDWTWISGTRKETIYDFYFAQYFEKKEVLLPAQPFSVATLT